MHINELVILNSKLVCLSTDVCIYVLEVEIKEYSNCVVLVLKMLDKDLSLSTNEL